MANNKTRWLREDPPNTLLAIDPGVRWPKSGVPYAGASLYIWGKLTICGLFKVETHIPPFQRAHRLVEMVCSELRLQRHPKENGSRVNVLAVEKPMLYVRGAARPQDIIDLREIYGAFMGGITADFYSGPTPGEWKGSVDAEKDISNEKFVNILDPGEQMMLVDAQARGQGGLSNHVLDSSGIGLYTLGRMDTGGVPT